MPTAREYCPKCQSVQNMTVSLTRSQETDVEGNIVEIVTRSLDCDNCLSFVRSEEIAAPDEVEEAAEESVQLKR